jgi:uncharacterized phage protein gp47/JayE
VPFKRDSIATIIERVYANYKSLFRPLDRTPRYNLLKVFASADAGMYHQLLGDLDFLALRIFPDSATGAYLREHWSSRVPPLYAIGAAGNVTVTGIAGRAVPSGLVFAAASGEKYYTEQAYKIGTDGTVVVRVKAQNTGARTNLAAGEELSVASSIPAGMDSTAVVAAGGLAGGTDAETDEEYLARVLAQIRNPARYGKPGDFAAWALDSSPEVSAAWEFKNFGVFGALLIQVINGTQASGVYQVANLGEVTDYLNSVAPPVIFTVRTPKIVNLNPSVALLAAEDTQDNRDAATRSMQAYLQLAASPGTQITAGALRSALVDGVAITDAEVKLNGDADGIVKTTILQYPYLGAVTWE